MGDPATDLRDVGFCILPGVLTPDEVASLRGTLDEATADAHEQNFIPSFALGLENVRDVFFSSKVVQSMQRLLGRPYVFYPNCTIRREMYVPWHLEAAFRGPVGGVSEDTFFVQCSIFLQDSDSVRGGGLEVVPKSHKRRFIDGDFFVRSDVLDIFRWRHTIPSHAGDLVVFDGRLLHQSAGFGSSGTVETKYSLFWTASTVDADRTGMLRHLAERKEIRKPSGELVVDPRFIDMPQVKFPESYPEGALASVTRGDVQIATLSEVIQPSAAGRT